MNPATVTIAQELGPVALKELQIREWEAHEHEPFPALLDRHHYLGAPQRLQCRLCQVVTHGDAVVALLVWSHAALRLVGREGFIGWDGCTRARRLGFVVQQSRFCLLSAKRPANMASCVLAMSVKHLPGAWQKRHGVEPLLAESFVDPERYQGTCHKAAGWIEVGRTAGFARAGSDYYLEHEHPKDLWLKPLASEGLERLRNPLSALAGEKRRAPGKMPVSARQAMSLSEALREVTDPRSRKGCQFPQHAMLGCAVLALGTGARSVSDIFRFCQDLSAPQRRNLGFRSNPQARAVVPPPGENCWRKVLREVDPRSLAQALCHWQESQGQSLPRMLAIDGKVIGKNLATLVSVVDPKTGMPLMQAAAAGAGHEMAPGQELVDKIPKGVLDGRRFAGDALHSQKPLVRKLVQEHGAEVLVQIKGNQKQTMALTDSLLGTQAPPICPHPAS
jgi:hypothetical protein